MFTRSSIRRACSFARAMDKAATISQLLDGRFSGRKEVVSLTLMTATASSVSRRTVTQSIRALIASQTPDTSLAACASEATNRCVISGRVASYEIGHDDRGGAATQLLLQVDGEQAPLPLRFAEPVADLGAWVGKEIVVEGSFRTRSVFVDGTMRLMPYVLVRNVPLSVQQLGM